MAGMTNLLVFVWGWIGARFPRRCNVLRVGCVMAQEPVSHTLRFRAMRVWRHPFRQRFLRAPVATRTLPCFGTTIKDCTSICMV